MFRRTLCAAALLCVVALAGGVVTAIAASAPTHGAKKHKVAVKPKTGPRGKPGAPGAAGKHGKNGPAGATGPGGTNGANGANGTSGGNGTNGSGGAAGTSFLRTVIVSPNATTATGNGALLLAALAHLGTVNSGNPALIWVEPGVYDIGTSTLSLSSYTDLTGAGQDTTFITGEGSSAISAAANTEIRDVTVTATNGSGSATAITTAGGLRNTTAKAAGISAAIGVVANAPTLALINVNAVANTSGAGSLVVALQTTTSAAVSGGSFTAADGAVSGQASALQVVSGGAAVNGATFAATGGAPGTAYPIALVGGPSETVTVIASVLTGTGGLFVATGDTLDIGGSQVPGVITSVVGAAHCPDSWLATYATVNVACG